MDILDLPEVSDGKDVRKVQSWNCFRSAFDLNNATG